MNILMMARFERRTEILRVQIADQCYAPVAKRHAAIEQRERSMRIMLFARKL